MYFDIAFGVFDTENEVDDDGFVATRGVAAVYFDTERVRPTGPVFIFLTVYVRVNGLQRDYLHFAPVV